MGRETPDIHFVMNNDSLRSVATERDLRVIISSSMKTQINTVRACSAARSRLGAIRRSFDGLSLTTFKNAFNPHVWRRIEYSEPTVYPCRLSEIRQIGTGTALRHSPSCGISYEGQLQAPKLYLVSYSRLRGDLINLWKILRGDLGRELRAMFPLRESNRTRSHRLTLRKLESSGLPLVYQLSPSAASLWNSLPSEVVEEQNEVRFKRRLDEHLVRRSQRSGNGAKLRGSQLPNQLNSLLGATPIRRRHNELDIRLTSHIRPVETELT
ncbi:unnamed protein product [Echinostoma caproni]|uniref:Uncharacterized protein n=1 Tax=Echinostoma caproni TaxID=27848 RepID=A0A3P8LFC7_9TREM|nr:unnamed protein product [Echinostoma caproni]